MELICDHIVDISYTYRCDDEMITCAGYLSHAINK